MFDQDNRQWNAIFANDALVGQVLSFKNTSWWQALVDIFPFVMASWTQPLQTYPLVVLKPSSVQYFYGRITRDEAEEILNYHGCIEGSFLLRESISPLGNYAISLCHDLKVHHYSVEKQTDGSYMIPEGKKFPGPIELIMHHQNLTDGIITLLTTGCERGPQQEPVAFRGMTYKDLEDELIRKADSIKGVNKEKALGTQRQQLVIMLARDLHTKQPWFHGKIGREESQKRLTKSGHKDGKFLVRLSEDKKKFVICISYNRNTRHYLIDKDENNKFGIQDGPKFECIMMFVDHYHNKQDGLLCKLTEPCPCPGFDDNLLQKYMSCNLGNLEYFMMKHGVRRSLDSSSENEAASVDGAPQPVRHTDSQNKNRNRKLPPVPKSNLVEMIWDEEDHNSGPHGSGILLRGFGYNAKDLQTVYESIPKTLAYFDLGREQIEIQETLGAGQFGSVCKGLCTLSSGTKIPVAIKTLKQEDINSAQEQEPELIKEAKVMMSLTHEHIVGMIGVCKSGSIMLVLELAPLGQLNTFLQNHRDVTQTNIVELMWQVALGMQYLESKKFVHRDLAGRNVLLVSDHFAKISDFGMSKALGRGNNYYRAKEAGKWPLKWYAPECVYFWKFDSKSDVWSYGVTLWEATSYGDKPYKKMKGQDILRFIVEEDKRLAKPESCDDELYNVMMKCWIYEKDQRPSFSEIVDNMLTIYSQMQRVT